MFDITKALTVLRKWRLVEKSAETHDAIVTLQEMVMKLTDLENRVERLEERLSDGP